MMEEFASETDSEYTSYWRDWVGTEVSFLLVLYMSCCSVVTAAVDCKTPDLLG